jgi:hypothetical protein
MLFLLFPLFVDSAGKRIDKYKPQQLCEVEECGHDRCAMDERLLGRAV